MGRRVADRARMIAEASGATLQIVHVLEPVAEAMIAFEKRIGFPTTLSEIEGFSDSHIQRALSAAKNPQLESKLQNMPVPLTADQVDEYMGPILEAAQTGDFSRIRLLENQ